MALRTKTLIIICLTFGLLIGSFYLAFSTLFMAHYDRIEKSLVRKDVERGIAAFTNKAGDLATKVEDWAKYDDTYTFVSERSQSYIDGNLNYESLANLHLNHIIYYDLKGTILEGREVNRELGRVEELSREAQEKLGPLTPLSRVQGEDEAISGLVALSDRVLFVASLPIQDSARQATPNGALLQSIAITPEVVQRLGEQTKLSLSVSRLDDKDALPSLPLAEGGINSSTIVVEAVDEKRINGYGVISDIYGSPILLLKVSAQREIYQQTVQTRELILLLLLIGGGVSTAFLLIVLNYSVVVKLSNLSKELTNISKTRDVTRRVSSQGDDEIGCVASNVNQMLAALEEAEAQIIEAKDAAEQASRSKSQFVANVSHELRTPINCVINVLRSLFRGETSSARKQQLAMAADSSFALLALINDVLDFSKVESGKLVPDDQDFSLDAMIRGALCTVASKAYEREAIELLCRMDSDLSCSTRGDQQRLRQVLINLMGNAIKFTKSGAVTLTVSVEPSSQGVIFHASVRDTGIGIPRDKLVSVFEPFVQADGSIARDYQGTGLGLTISKEFVEAMGGEISVKSREGEGSEFSFFVPLKGSFIAPPRHTLSLPDRVLAVSRSHHLSLLLSDVLSLTGCEVDRDVASDNQERWRTYPAVVFDGASLDDDELHDYLDHSPSSQRKLLLLSPLEFDRKETFYHDERLVVMTKPLVTYDVLRVLAGETLEEAISSNVEAHLLSDCHVEGLPPLKVLVADDLESNQVILSSILEEVGHEVTVVNNGRELLDMATNYEKGDRSPFNVILTDVQMPGLDGITATRMIRSKERLDGLPAEERIPIVAITAHAMSDEIEQMKGAGVDAVVTKPVDPRQLSKVFESLCKKHIKRREVRLVRREDPALLKRRLEEILFSLFPDISGRQLFDPCDLIDRSRGNPRIIRTTLRVFLKEVNSLLNVLEEQIAAGDQEQIARAAHALRGSLLSASLNEGAALTERLEECVRRDGDMTACRSLWIPLEENVRLIVASLHTAYAQIERVLEDAQRV